MIEVHILKLPTPRLLAYFKKHYQRSNPHVDNDDRGIFNYDEAKFNEWQNDYQALKTELDKRKHVEK